MEKNLPALQVTGLKKQYPGFSLGPVSLSLRPGSILGFIGRNGAGKTTTLRALLGMVRPEEGEISFFGRSFSGNELEIKEQAGFVSGGAEYYPRKKLRTITAVTRGFYPNWDEAAYQHYSRLFELSPAITGTPQRWARRFCFPAARSCFAPFSARRRPILFPFFRIGWIRLTRSFCPRSCSCCFRGRSPTWFLRFWPGVFPKSGLSGWIFKPALILPDSSR